MWRNAPHLRVVRAIITRSMLSSRASSRNAGYWRDDMSQTRRASAAGLTHRWSKSDSNPFWSHLPGSACLFRAELYRGGLEARHPCPAGRGATILPAQRTLASHKPGRRRPGSPDFSRMYVIPERVRSPFPPAANQPCRTKKARALKKTRNRMTGNNAPMVPFGLATPVDQAFSLEQTPSDGWSDWRLIAADTSGRTL